MIDFHLISATSTCKTVREFPSQTGPAELVQLDMLLANSIRHTLKPHLA
jgi:hypothetical protein